MTPFLFAQTFPRTLARTVPPIQFGLRNPQVHGAAPALFHQIQFNGFHIGQHVHPQQPCLLPTHAHARLVAGPTQSSIRHGSATRPTHPTRPTVVVAHFAKIPKQIFFLNDGRVATFDQQSSGSVFQNVGHFTATAAAPTFVLVFKNHDAGPDPNRQQPKHHHGHGVAHDNVPFPIDAAGRDSTIPQRCCHKHVGRLFSRGASTPARPHVRFCFHQFPRGVAQHGGDLATRQHEQQQQQITHVQKQGTNARAKRLTDFSGRRPAQTGCLQFRTRTTGLQMQRGRALVQASKHKTSLLRVVLVGGVVKFVGTVGTVGKDTVAPQHGGFLKTTGAINTSALRQDFVVTGFAHGAVPTGF